MKENIYEVYWKGPYTPDTILDIEENDDNKFVLYKVYGSHPIYGRRNLLYIGMTERGVKKRLSEHDYWMDEKRYGASEIFVASAGEFHNWPKSNKIEIFDKLPKEIITKIEALLIIAHQPVHNSKSRNTAELAKGVRLFNTGNYGQLLPEVSSLYYDI